MDLERPMFLMPWASISRGKPFFAESDLRCIQNEEGYFRVEG